MRLSEILFSLGVALLAMGWGANGSWADETRPNILLILADDWGWGDLPSHGRAGLLTPNLDRLIRRGTDFHQFTVNGPVCSPTRAAILTGQYPARHSIHHAIGGARIDNMADWLDPRAVLLPRLLKDAGYATAHYGKWHLGGAGIRSSAPKPTEYGYDDSAVWTGSGRSVWEGTSLQEHDGNAHDSEAASYMSVAATENAIRFVRSVGAKPFFLNLWLHETHHLVSATDDDKKAYPNLAEPERTYFAAITRADRLIGQLLATLDELGKTDNTLILFTSDNGPEETHAEPKQKFYYSVGKTGGLRGRKRSLFLGGINVPLIVCWPQKVPAGRVDTTSILSGVDLLPTICAVAKVNLPPDYQGDGVNALEAFLGRPFERKRPLFWDWRASVKEHAFNWPANAMIDGEWGLVVDEGSERVELYHLRYDREQATNLAAQYPERVASMARSLAEWRSTLPRSPSPSCVETSDRPAKSPPKKMPASTPIDTAQRANAFQRWDKDRNGALTAIEYEMGLANKSNAAQRFKGFDRNGDGLLSLEEFIQPKKGAK